jgi:hypothetical protein
VKAISRRPGGERALTRAKPSDVVPSHGRRLGIEKNALAQATLVEPVACVRAVRLRPGGCPVE